jgi:hypothetical protein
MRIPFLVRCIDGIHINDRVDGAVLKIIAVDRDRAAELSETARHLAHKNV